MKVLIVTFNDSDNLMIENVLRELERRGHEITIFAQFQDDGSLRMFRDINVDIRPLQDLTPRTAKRFDIAFCAAMTTNRVKFLDLYCFAFSPYYEETYMTDGADFLFSVRDTPMPRCDFRCAYMPIGNPKNDKIPSNSSTSSKRILYVDSGHIPFGTKGKEQIADMLLNICNQFPDYELCIKPRWLRKATGTVHYTHRDAEHIYDIIESRCCGNIPSNLNMLEEHINLQDLIDSSVSVITLYSGAHFDVILRDKGLLIASGWDCEDMWQLRNSIALQKEMFKESGCVVDYREITKYLPLGIHAKKSYEEKMFLYRWNVSARIVDVMEYIYCEFLSKGIYPAPKKYSYETYRTEMIQDKSITITTLKKERIRDILLQMVALFSYRLSVQIDFSRYYTELEKTYKSFPLTENGYQDCLSVFNTIKNEIIVEQAYLLNSDPIDQAFLLKAMYELGQESDILRIPGDQILCKGPYHYYLGKICQKQHQALAAIEHFRMFLKEANSRAYNKYPQEEEWGIRDAYNYLFDVYDDDNIPSEEFADLCFVLYERRNPIIVSYDARKRAHNLLPQVTERLIKRDSDRALRCLQLYAEWEYHYNIREMDNQLIAIQNSKFYRVVNRISWFIRKLMGGVRCLQEHGWRYTYYRLRRHVANYIKKNQFLKIYRKYFQRILYGYKIYSELAAEIGDPFFVHIAAGGNGDVYLILQHYRSYIKKYHSDKKNILVSDSGSFSSLCDWWQIDSVKQLTPDQWQDIIHLYVFSSNVNMDILHPHIFIRHTGILAYLEGIHGMNFMALQEAVLFEHLMPSKPNLCGDDSELEKIFEDHKLEIGKTVVLSPYAQSLPSVREEYWTKLTGELNKMGLSVCTNAFGAQLPIAGTVKIELPFCKLERFLNKAGYCVSLRSGFDDITHNSSCRRVEVYAKNTLKRSLVVSVIECFAYSKHPIIVDEDNIDACVEETIVQLDLKYKH